MGGQHRSYSYLSENLIISLAGVSSDHCAEEGKFIKTFRRRIYLLGSRKIASAETPDKATPSFP